MALRVAGLFAGIGGFEVGFHNAGFETALLCENDEAARRVLEARFPNVESVHDVRDIDRLPNVDVVCAGFPCQDLSSSGLKEGIGGTRSGLVSEVFRILRGSTVDWLVIENVPFMLHLKSGSAMRAIVFELESLGFKWAYRVLDSLAFGVPQRRKRVFLVASRSYDPAPVLFDVRDTEMADPPHGDVWLTKPIGFYWTEGAYSTGLAFDALPPLKGGSTIGIPSPPGLLLPDGGCVTPDLRDAERLQGFEAGWTEPAVDGRRSGARWRLIGNAVTVPVAEWLAGRIAEPPNALSVRAVVLKDGARWPDAACGDNKSRYAVDVSHYPAAHPRVAIADFLRYEGRPLSVRAIRGFLKRAGSGGLRYPPGFLAALDSYARRTVVPVELLAIA